MPKYDGVYQDAKGRWYFKVWLGRDPLTGRQVQVTKRGFATAADAARARRKELDDTEDRPSAPSLPASLTVDDLLDLHLDGLDADERLSAKTRFDYRINAKSYVRPWLGKKRVRDLTPEVIVAWQRKLMAEGGVKDGKPLSANTVRLARSPLAGALKLAVAQGVIRSSPVASVSRPSTRRTVPKHWSPEQAREFLGNQEGDRMYPALGVPARFGAADRRAGLAALAQRRPEASPCPCRRVRVDPRVGPSGVPGQERDCDTHGRSRCWSGRGVEATARHAALRGRRDGYEASDYVFTKPAGGHYHPQVISKMLARASEEAGLPRLTAHGLRHTSATLMLDSGVAPKVAAERLGHADASLFMNLYSHVTPTMQSEAADKLGAALFGDT